MKKKNKKGIIVRFEILDDNDNVTNIIAEKVFPNATFNSWRDSLSPRLTKYSCFDRDVNEYVSKQHQINNLKFNYADWKNSPNIIQAFYNIDNVLMYTINEVEYEMGL